MNDLNVNQAQWVLIILSAFLIVGCSNKGYKITYNTFPEGAAIVCNGKNKGYSPVTLTYEPDKETKKIGKMATQPCMAVWSSGVKQSFNTTWDLNAFPKGVMQTIDRPSGGDYSQDAEFALRVQRMRQEKAAADAAAHQRTMDSINNLNRQLRDSRTKTTTCSEVYGTVVCTTN